MRHADLAMLPVLRSHLLTMPNDLGQGRKELTTLVVSDRLQNMCADTFQPASAPAATVKSPLPQSNQDCASSLPEDQARSSRFRSLRFQMHESMDAAFDLSDLQRYKGLYTIAYLFPTPCTTPF